jgi:hypothetical protein
MQLHGDAQTHGVGAILQKAEWEFWVEQIAFAGA